MSCCTSELRTGFCVSTPVCTHVFTLSSRSSGWLQGYRRPGGEERQTGRPTPLSFVCLFLFLCVSSFSPLFCLMKSYKKSFSIDHHCSSTSEGDLASVISFLVRNETRMSVTWESVPFKLPTAESKRRPPLLQTMVSSVSIFSPLSFLRLFPPSHLSNTVTDWSLSSVNISPTEMHSRQTDDKHCLNLLNFERRKKTKTANDELWSKYELKVSSLFKHHCGNYVKNCWNR